MHGERHMPPSAKPNAGPSARGSPQPASGRWAAGTGGTRGAAGTAGTAGVKAVAGTGTAAPGTRGMRMGPAAAHGLALPPALAPLVRAYLLGYASVVAPRLLSTLVAFAVAYRRKRRQAAAQAAAGKLATSPSGPDHSSAGKPDKASLAHLRASIGRVLRTGLDIHRFPTFCAALVGGSTFFEIPFRRLLARWVPTLSALARARIARYLATVIASCLSLRLLQTAPSPRFVDTVVDSHESVAIDPATGNVKERKTTTTKKTVHYAGRTLDLTLFAVTRAADVLIGELWARHKARRTGGGSKSKWTPLEAFIGRGADSALFIASNYFIMWAWMYLPWKLPPTYDKWITTAASVDHRLIEALRRCRKGALRYTEDMGAEARLLEGMCADYGWPAVWGDPEKTVPFPCEMVHMDCGPSCEYHAFVRFVRSWRWAMATYLPLSLLVMVSRPRNRNLHGLLRALQSALRSSAFLGTFITLFYYGVCLMRTRLGPRILGTSTAVRNAIDGGLCTASGCFLCGWSIVVETAGRRKDMALFVAPRALGTLMPRRYPLDRQWMETLAFAMSTGVVFTAIRENPKRVRGFMGSLLSTVLVP